MLRFVFATLAILAAHSLAFGAWAQSPVTSNPQVGDVAVISPPPQSPGVCGNAIPGQPQLCVSPNQAIPLGYFAKATDLSALNQQFTAFSATTNNLSRQMGRQSEGVALSIAQARTAGLAEGKTYALSLGFGGFEGKGSAGLGGTARLSDRIFLSGGLGVGLSSGVVGGGAAVSFQW